MNSLKTGTQRNDLHRLENIPFSRGCEAVLQLEKRCPTLLCYVQDRIRPEIEFIGEKKTNKAS